MQNSKGKSYNSVCEEGQHIWSLHARTHARTHVHAYTHTVKFIIHVVGHQWLNIFLSYSLNAVFPT